MTKNIKSFLIKIASNNNLVEKFKNAPESVMNSFNLSEEEQKYVLNSEDIDSDNDTAKGYLTVIFAPTV